MEITVDDVQNKLRELGTAGKICIVGRRDCQSSLKIRNNYEDFVNTMLFDASPEQRTAMVNIFKRTINTMCRKSYTFIAQIEQKKYQLINLELIPRRLQDDLIVDIQYINCELLSKFSIVPLFLK